MRARERYTRHSSWRTSLYSPSYPVRNGFNLGTSSSAPVSSGSTRRLRRDTRAESLSDSGSVEVVVASPTRRPRRHAQQVASNNDTPVTPRVLPSRKGKRRNIYTPTTSPRKQRRFVAPPRDPTEADDLDDEVEIIVDMPQRAPKAKPQPTSKYRRSQPAAARVYPAACRICVHFHPYVIAWVLATAFLSRRQLARRPPTDNPSRACLRGDRRAAACSQPLTDVVQSSFRRQQDATNATTSNPAGFCYEEPATGAHGLLANPPAAASPSSLVDCGVSATTSDDPGPSLQQHSDMDLDLDVRCLYGSHGLGGGCGGCD